MTIKPNELIGDKYQNIHTSGLWKEQWNQMIIEMGTIIINKGREIKDAISSYSGGGCYHFIIKTDDGYIYHLDSEAIWYDESHFIGKDECIEVVDYKWGFYRNVDEWDDIDDYYDKWNNWSKELASSIDSCEHFQMESRLEYNEEEF